MDIGGWLRNLGLEKYEAVLRDNEIDDAVLPKLTEDHLRELGFPLGARLKLLDAIAALGIARPGATTGQEPPSIGSATSTTSARRGASGERRQVTVMFSDLVGSTALAARMDPEDLRDVIAAPRGPGGNRSTPAPHPPCILLRTRRSAARSRRRPSDDAERAVRAGLELIAAVGALKAASPLQTRVGIATGLVVVGDLVGSGEAQERGIVGETPNLAARLQGVAEPNSVVIAESTRKLLGGLFELEDLGAMDLKGISRPVQAWVALRTSSLESRFEALRTTTTPLIGRDEEIELLMRRWSKAKAGEGQVVLLSGEPGIGKSRLAAALLERLAGEPRTQLRYFCSPQHTDSALYPMIVGQLEHAAGFTYDDTSLAKLDKLDALLAQYSTPREEVALFAEMMSLPNDGRYPRLDELTPQQRRQRTLEALTAQIEARSRQKPVLMIFEDVHWIDATSLEALGQVVDRIRAVRVLLIVTYRPEFEPPWIGRPHVTALILNRLGDREVAAIIEGVIGNKPLPASIRKGISERSDGIPLFVEEIAKSVLEAIGEALSRSRGRNSSSPSSFQQISYSSRHQLAVSNPKGNSRENNAARALTSFRGGGRPRLTTGIGGHQACRTRSRQTRQRSAIAPK
jgi:class 3 adenylate cyclase